MRQGKDKSETETAPPTTGSLKDTGRPDERIKASGETTERGH